MLTLAIESSCDEFSVALLDDSRKLLMVETLSQVDLHAQFGGVIPELASREHVKGFLILMEKVEVYLEGDWTKLKEVAVTVGPGLSGSLLVGLQVAKTIAVMMNIPLIPVHHILGHVYSSALTEEIEYPMMSLVVSGGHTELIYSKDECSHQVLGQTRDDAVGEVYDKIARKLGLPYPGGPAIDMLAQEGKNAFDFPKIKMDEPFAFSFSGLKSSVINQLNTLNMKNQSVNASDISHSFQRVVVDELLGKLELALQTYPSKSVTICGGVSANQSLRENFLLMKEKFPQSNFILPKMKYCGDNAAMIGAASHTISPMRNREEILKLECYPNLAIDEFYQKFNNEV